MLVGKLRHKLEVWKNEHVLNGDSELENQPVKVKEIWAQLIPQTGSMGKRQGVETILTNCTHKVIVRYNAGKDITSSMWFMYCGHRFEIIYILNPFFANETLEVFVEEVIG